jgi:hypothetical protein
MIDISKFRLSSEELDRLSQTLNGDRRKTKHNPPRKQYRLFIPAVPLEWIYPVFLMPQKSVLHVALIIWQKTRMRRNQEYKLNLSRMQEWGLSAKSAGEALAILERAGLVCVKRKPGCAALVKVVMPSANEAGKARETPQNTEGWWNGCDSSPR